MYEYDYRIGFSMCGADRKLTIPAMMDVLQDASTFQSDDLGVGYSRLDIDNLMWVLNYWEINIDRMPMLSEQVKVGTFPYDFKGCFGNRNFYIKNADGEYIVKANTLWTLLNNKTMFPAKAPEDIVNAYELEPKLDMTYSSRKVTLPKDANVTEATPILVQTHHLDGNAHVNNGQYVKMAIASMEEVLRGREDEKNDNVLDGLKSLRIDYRKQAMLGDTLYPVICETDDAIYVALNDAEGSPYSVSEYK